MQLHVHLGDQIDTENTYRFTCTDCPNCCCKKCFHLLMGGALHMIALYFVFKMPSALRFDGSVLL